MTKRIVAHTSWDDQIKDQISEWFWTQVGKAIMVGALISVPMAAYGAITAPHGTHRADAAMTAIGDGHEFLWDHAFIGLEWANEAIFSIGENGSEAN
jgi:hypothetical protein